MRQRPGVLGGLMAGPIARPASRAFAGVPGMNGGIDNMIHVRLGHAHIARGDGTVGVELHRRRPHTAEDDDSTLEQEDAPDGDGSSSLSDKSGATP